MLSPGAGLYDADFVVLEQSPSMTFECPAGLTAISVSLSMAATAQVCNGFWPCAAGIWEKCCAQCVWPAWRGRWFCWSVGTRTVIRPLSSL